MVPHPDRPQTVTQSTLVILTFNEIEGSRALVDRVPFHAVDEWFVVDGGSTDGTIELWRERGGRVLLQPRPGRGEAFRLAVQEARGDWLIFFSPDGNEDPSDIPKLLDLLRLGHDMAVASRFLPGSKNEEDELRLPWRAWANRAFTWWANLIWGGRLSDSINGFRGVTREAFQRMNPDAEGFAIEFQMSIRALKLGLKVGEIPTIEGHRIGGESKAHSLTTGLRFLRYLFREMSRGQG